MVEPEFKFIAGNTYTLGGRFKTQNEARTEQLRNNQLDTSKVIMAKVQGGKRVYELWVRD